MYYDFYGNPLTVRAICHRGWTQDGAYENSLEAFQQAKSKGYNYVECDVRLTGDSQLVLLHADSVAGYTISATDYETLVTACPSLLKFSDFMTWCKSNGVHPYIDFKCSDYANIAAVVIDAGMVGSITFLNSSMEPYCPGCEYCDLIESYSESIEFSKYTGNKFLSINSDNWSWSNAVSARSAGAKRIQIYTCNDLSTVNLFVAKAQIEGITTDKILPSNFTTIYVYDYWGNLIDTSVPAGKFDSAVFDTDVFG